MKRLAMLSIAAKGRHGHRYLRHRALLCRAPRTPSTPSTLLRERYPDYRFKLIAGSDNWRVFDQWRDPRRILEEYGVIVYPRPGYPVESRHVDGLEVVEAPMVNLSSTFSYARP